MLFPVGNGVTEDKDYILQCAIIYIARASLVPLCAEQIRWGIAPKREGKDGEHTEGQVTERSHAPRSAPILLNDITCASKTQSNCSLVHVVVLCPKASSSICNLNSSANFDSCDPYHHKAVLFSNAGRFGKAAGQTVSFPSLAMTSDPAQLNIGFPTRKSVQ